MNPILAQAISFFANLILGADVFSRILAAVERWADKEIAEVEKKKANSIRRNGVLDELEIIGIGLGENLARLGIELAVKYLKLQA